MSECKEIKGQLGASECGASECKVRKSGASVERARVGQAGEG